jgi:hypothetical protein
MKPPKAMKRRTTAAGMPRHSVRMIQPRRRYVGVEDHRDASPEFMANPGPLVN